MDTKKLCFVLCVLLCIFGDTVCSSGEDDRDSICSLRGCNCTRAASTWKDVNCTFDSAQTVTLTPGSIPDTVLELFTTGGKELVIHPLTFSSLQGLILIRIDGTKRVVLSKHSFYNSSSPNLLLQIQNCDRVFIETGAFKNMQSSVEVEISRTSYVAINQNAFSKMRNAKFKEISKLVLSENTFEFENQSNIGRHGPVTTLSFNNVYISVVPRHTFFSSLAEISIESSIIDEIQTEAFTASEISAVLIVNSTIGKIRKHAFIERTLVYNFKVTKCNISLLETRAIVVGAISNLTVEYSKITDIQTGAINSTVANTVVTDNEIEYFRTAAFSLNAWNKININSNYIKYLHTDFIEAPLNPDIIEFTFTDNVLYHVDSGTFSIASHINKVLVFDNNFFNETCHCDIRTWLESVFDSKNVDYVMDTSYCIVTGVLSRCFQIKVGLINMQNFTELVCKEGDTIVCEPYVGDVKVIDTTSKMLFDDSNTPNSGLILGLTLGALLIIAISGTIVILLIRGGLWLKRKGYFRNIRYSHNESSNDEENTIVTVDRNTDKLDVPEELTPELLQTLRERLEDPLTHNEAREMIEKLYDMFIVDESYTNNNRQDDEAHLYEELGNLQMQRQRESGSQETLDNPDGAMDFLRLIEERFNFQSQEHLEPKPALVGDYSEPTDAAVHLYSELRQNKNDNESSEKKNSVKSSNSGSMSFRPLPDKPDSARPGPSTKL